MAGRKCIFCGTPHALTREHVLPVWLQEYVGGDEPGEFRGTRANFFGMPLDERKASPNSHTLKVVCGECNNGWMSRLEVAFSAILPRLEMDINPRRFSKTERATIAKWIVKTGIIAHLSSNYRRILPETFPISLSRGQAIPGRVRVFGGNVAESKSIRWIQSNLASTVLSRSDLASFDPLKDSFVFILSIRKVFLGFGWHDLNRNAMNLSLNDSSLHQFYPRPQPAQISKVFDDLQMASFGLSLSPR
ncbi:hypothetical protein [Pelagibacterium halotolerans]|uniref:hypothetical protein n=1 Tax=Pelagibacterium halotolerans TaxID=531813 RepID=UPI00384E69E6